MKNETNAERKNMNKTSRRRAAGFIRMARPLEFPVRCGRRVVIPAGAEGVYISFRTSHLRRIDEATGETVPMNRYIWRGRLIHS